ncbi:MAG: hypothetical protein KDA20_05400 [Phycisphaerales bacterium]|nr:hypothetical protein [Phycisphaerales bacterium]
MRGKIPVTERNGLIRKLCLLQIVPEQAGRVITWLLRGRAAASAKERE